MYVYIYICMYVCIYVCMYVCMYVCYIYIFIYLFIYLFICLFIYIASSPRYAAILFDAAARRMSARARATFDPSQLQPALRQAL